MDKIRQMIKDLCAGEVEMKTLGEVCVWDKRFNGMAKIEQPEVCSFKHVSAACLKAMEEKDGTVKLLSTGKFDGYTSEETAGAALNVGEVIAVPSGGAANLKYYNGKFVDSGNILAIAKDETICLKFVWYFMLTKNDLIQSCYRGSAVAHPSMPDILQISVPVPPLPVQQAIAGILDTFTELQARKLQYEYYRGKLLTNEKWEVKTLGEVCEVITGGEAPQNSVPAPDETNKYAIWANGAEVYGYTNRYKIDKDCCTISSIGANTGTVYFREAYFTPIIRLKVLVPKSNNVISKYLFYFLSSIKIHSKKSSVPNLNAADVKKLRLPVPPLSEQLRIVSILDKFDKLVNSLSEGLPAEIKMRQQQYEYYREKLLAFN